MIEVEDWICTGQRRAMYNRLFATKEIYEVSGIEPGWYYLVKLDCYFSPRGNESMHIKSSCQLSLAEFQRFEESGWIPLF